MSGPSVGGGGTFGRGGGAWGGGKEPVDRLHTAQQRLLLLLPSKHRDSVHSVPSSRHSLLEKDDVF